MSTKGCLFIAVMLLCLTIPGGCGYRFVQPVQAGGLNLTEVANSTAEPGLAAVLEDSFRSLGIRQGNGGRNLQVAITDFSDKVSTITSAGTPIRQRVSMTVFWKLGNGDPSRGTFGEESASLSYPYSPDPATLDWNRRAAVKLLCGKIADQVKFTLRGLR